MANTFNMRSARNLFEKNLIQLNAYLEPLGYQAAFMYKETGKPIQSCIVMFCRIDDRSDLTDPATLEQIRKYWMLMGQGSGWKREITIANYVEE